ncbi:MAG: hypothetical protein QOI88_4099 [Gammaproteobacteria bacterium]|nr:hypothetical protein [Gammaproteobacteria bacterium]
MNPQYPTHVYRKPKRQYILALVCYLSIPAVMIASGVLFRLIDPEMARGSADYVRNYRLLELARTGALMAMVGLALALWALTCYLVLKSRQRSLGWLLLAAAGPFGFIVIAMLEDRAPASYDLYQQFIQKLKLYWRVPIEIAAFVTAWSLAFELMVLKRDLMIRYESFMSGTPVATIIDSQNQSSGMWAFNEGNEVIYLVVLIYLLWPVFFNVVGQPFKRRTNATGQDSRHSSG